VQQQRRPVRHSTRWRLLGEERENLADTMLGNNDSLYSSKEVTTWRGLSII
jgi:hypothetical protein